MKTKKFIEKAKTIHGDKYDYSKVEYVYNYTKVCIICPIHGEFWQTPNVHLDGCGCPKCGIERRSQKKKITLTTFIERAKIIHENKYDYSKVEYVDLETKVCIICPIHGEFWQTPASHVLSKHQCPKCAHRSYKKTTEEFINEAQKIHGDKFDYSNVVYENRNKKVKIICPIHGEFWQTPKIHMRSKTGCPKCSEEIHGDDKRLLVQKFIEKAKIIHGDKYDYSKVDYENTDTKICIICPIHGEFWQAPHNHITQKQGCPKCTSSHLENEIKMFFQKNNINFIEEKTFDWLKYKNNLFLDFYLPDYNMAIECQGEQHYARFRWENNDNLLKLRQERDKHKYDLCKKHGIKIIYFSFKQFADDIITDTQSLLEEIIKTNKENNEKV